MSRRKDIEAILKRCKADLEKIYDEYRRALHDKAIPVELQIDLKNFFGNLRSVLDFIAKDIVGKYCPNASAKDMLYFPIKGDAIRFTAAMKKSYPDLETNSKRIYDILEELQPYKHLDNGWLSTFNEVNNDNKHDALVPQTRKETKVVRVETRGGGAVSWTQGVTFSGGVSINGVPIDPRTQLPVPSSTQTVTKEIWVDFHFDGFNVSALSLIEESLKRITELYDRIKDDLE